MQTATFSEVHISVFTCDNVKLHDYCDNLMVLSPLLIVDNTL